MRPLAAPRSRVRRVSWAAFRREWFNRWTFLQGQHVSLIGPTGRGKTTLAVKGILPIRVRSGGYLVALDVKGDDPSLVGAGLRTVKAWPPRAVDPEHRAFRLAPANRRRSDLPAARRVFAECLDYVYAEGRWAIYVDELRAIADSRYMGLSAPMEALWLYGRSRDISVIANSQAPRWVPRAMYDQASHLFLFRNRDDQAVKRLAEIGGETKLLQDVVRDLDRHEFLYVDVAADRMVISSVRL